jgi:hypothetical protein
LKTSFHDPSAWLPFTPSRRRDRFEFAAKGSGEMETEEEMSLWNEMMSLR